MRAPGHISQEGQFMSRKRLGRLDPDAASRARDAAEQAVARKTLAGGTAEQVNAPKGPPIARMAAGVGQEIDAEIRRLKQELQAHAERTAAMDAAGGRMIVAVDLDQIDTGHLTRDRLTLNREGDDWIALKKSIQARGQQTPIEITDLGADRKDSTGPRYGLISGLRRISVLRELLEETGDERFALVLALVSPVSRVQDKLVAMIEENEIRSGISFFERGRIASIAAAEGIFADADDAVDILFASSNRNRRYKIRNFVTVYETVGERLLYPEALGERLGLALARAIREDNRGPELAMTLDGYPDRTPAQEMAILTRVATGGAPFPDLDAAGQDARGTWRASWSGGDGMKIRARAKPGSQRITLDIQGLGGVDQASLQRLVRWLGDEIEAASQEQDRQDPD